MDIIDKRIINYLKKEEFSEYKPEELYGVFFNGKRVYSITGVKFWTSEANAKKAMCYMFSVIRRRNFSSKYYTKYMITPDIVDQFDVNKLMKAGLLEIKKVGNT